MEIKFDSPLVDTWVNFDDYKFHSDRKAGINRRITYRSKNYRRDRRKIEIIYQSVIDNVEIEFDPTTSEFDWDESTKIIIKQISWVSYKYIFGSFKWWIPDRKDGPAIIEFDSWGDVLRCEWNIGDGISNRDINAWIDEMGFPPFHRWDKSHHVAFKLAFA